MITIVLIIEGVYFIYNKKINISKLTWVKPLNYICTKCVTHFKEVGLYKSLDIYDLKFNTWYLTIGVCGVNGFLLNYNK